MPHKVKTLIIEDSGLTRIVFAEILRKDPQIEVVGTASNGKEGVTKAYALQPDVIITDMMMPQYDGFYVVEEIMRNRPTPIILVSSLEKENTQVFEALNAGAVDFVSKEYIIQDSQAQQQVFISLVKTVASASISNLIFKKQRSNHHSHQFDGQQNYRIIAIGSSTGGPGAIEQIIVQLPDNLNIPVVIAQHMPSSFIESFARRLNQMTPLRVKVAEKNEVLQGGTVYMAPGDINTQILKEAGSRQAVVAFTQKQFEEFNHPSVDCLFSSVAHTFKEKAIGVVLTGMGRDGSLGLQEIKNAGGYTIAQDEKSSVVFGMPKAAAESGAVRKVVSLHDIPGFLISCL